MIRWTQRGIVQSLLCRLARLIYYGHIKRGCTLLYETVAQLNMRLLRRERPSLPLVLGLEEE